MYSMKTKVKQGIAGMSVPELTGYTTHVVSKMENNSFFPSPSPALDKVTEAKNALQDSYNLALDGSHQQKATMDKCVELLEFYLSSLGFYVESIANDPVNAGTTSPDTIILSAGMGVRDFSLRQKQGFGVKHGNVSGSVDLTGPSVDRGSHEWQYSADPSNPNNWVDAESTVRASTTIGGLEIGKRYYFRHRLVTPDGLTEWDEPESIVVV